MSPQAVKIKDELRCARALQHLYLFLGLLPFNSILILRGSLETVARSLPRNKHPFESMIYKGRWLRSFQSSLDLFSYMTTFLELRLIVYKVIK
jgi:hypothetical protein